MENNIVDIEIAKLLKSIEFDEKCRNHYLEGISRSTGKIVSKLAESNFDYTNTELDENFSDCTFMYTGIVRYAAPSIYEVTSWLRSKLKMHIIIYPKFKRDDVLYTFQVVEYDPNSPNFYGRRSTGVFGDFPTEYEAYRNGILISLKSLRS